MTIPDLSTWLQSHRTGDSPLTLSPDEVQSIQGELQRLRQSNDRMRKQNSKLRKRIARLKGGHPDTEEDSGAEPPD